MMERRFRKYAPVGLATLCFAAVLAPWANSPGTDLPYQHAVPCKRCYSDVTTQASANDSGSRRDRSFGCEWSRPNQKENRNVAHVELCTDRSCGAEHLSCDSSLGRHPGRALGLYQIQLSRVCDTVPVGGPAWKLGYAEPAAVAAARSSGRRRHVPLSRCDLPPPPRRTGGGWFGFPSVNTAFTD